MYSGQKVFRLICAQCAAWRYKPTVTLGLILGMCFALAPTMNMLRASTEAMTPIQIFEPFVIIASNSYTCLPIMLGLIMMLSDAPFIHEDVTFIALRVSRSQWMIAQCLYILLTCIVFLATIFLFTLALCARTSYIGNLWSPTLLRISRDSGFAYRYTLSFPNELFLHQFAPYQSLGVCVMLQLAYGFVLSMIMFTLNLSYRRGAGIVAALALHQLGYIMLRDGFMFANQYLSLMVHALPTTHSFYAVTDHLPTLSQSSTIFICSSLLLIGCCLLKAKKVDFLISSIDG